jgi:hypothetical protein
MTKRERSTLFNWLEVIIQDYEDEVGDEKGKDVWNWMIDRYKPDGFIKMEDQ